MWNKILVAGLTSFILALPAQAQNPWRIRIFGIIENVNGRDVTITNSRRENLTFHLTPNARVISDEPLDVKAIKVGDYISIDTVMVKAKRMATQFHTQSFSHGMDAAAQRRVDSNPEATRWLGSISAVSPTVKGIVVTETLQKNGGTLQIELTSEMPHYRAEPESIADLKPNMAVMTGVRDGTLQTGLVTVEKNGHKPIDTGD